MVERSIEILLYLSFLTTLMNQIHSYSSAFLFLRRSCEKRSLMGALLLQAPVLVESAFPYFSEFCQW